MLRNHHKHRSQNQNEEKPYLSEFDIIFFPLSKYKDWKSPQSPRGPIALGQESYIQPQQINTIESYCFWIFFLRDIVPDSFWYKDSPRQFLLCSVSFCIFAAVIAHLSLYSWSYLCPCLQPRTNIAHQPGFTLQLTETSLSSLSLRLQKICCCACHFQEI